VDRYLGLRQRCEVVRRQQGSGELLDVGCGTGDFLAVMRGNPGWKVRGLEPVADAARRAQSNYGLFVDAIPLDESAYPAKSFDAVTMWDVLEHLPDPLASLKKLSAVLRPGGTLVASVPNGDSFDARLFGPYWAGLDVPRHFSVFTQRHLREFIAKSGLEPPSFLSLGSSFHSFALSVRMWARSDGGRRLSAHLTDQLMNTLPVRIATLPYFRLLKTLNLSATLVVVARKPAAG
jgi:SAM-dependent methyltransferase